MGYIIIVYYNLLRFGRLVDKAYHISTAMSLSKGYQDAENGLVPLRNSFLLPTAKLDDQKFEFYFLVDVSGSMSGSPWKLASRALLV